MIVFKQIFTEFFLIFPLYLYLKCIINLSISAPCWTNAWLRFLMFSPWTRTSDKRSNTDSVWPETVLHPYVSANRKPDKKNWRGARTGAQVGGASAVWSSRFASPRGSLATNVAFGLFLSSFGRPFGINTNVFRYSDGSAAREDEEYVTDRR